MEIKMNDVVENIIKQATDKIMGVPFLDKKKFAELIVRECITICEELGDKGLDGHYCADKINKTFRS